MEKENRDEKLFHCFPSSRIFPLAVKNAKQSKKEKQIKAMKEKRAKFPREKKVISLTNETKLIHLMGFGIILI
jgi:hypothetical protein